jgi:prolyl-tRNA synthetase
VHSDDNGLVLPPRIAPLQVVVVPIVQKGKEALVVAAATELGQELAEHGIRVKVDDRDDKKPGWKFSYWELKGVPLRIELGPRDIESGKVMASWRCNGKKEEYERKNVAGTVKDALALIQKTMLLEARKLRDARIAQVHEWTEFLPVLDRRCMVLAPWCETTNCEEAVKTKSKEESLARAGEKDEDARSALSGAAKTLCIPFPEEIERLGIDPLAAGTRCFACEENAKSLTLWGRSY